MKLWTRNKLINFRWHIWLLAFALFATQTFMVSHIHFHEEQENTPDVVSSGFTPAVLQVLLETAQASDSNQHPQYPDEHGESCELCLLVHLSWLPAATFVTFKPQLVNTTPLTVISGPLSGTYVQFSLARAPPQIC